MSAANPPRKEPFAARWARIRALLQGVLGVVGIAALAGLVRHVGAHALLDILRRAASLVPVLMSLEAARLGCDTLATMTLCPPRRVPLRELIRVHVIAYPVATLMPAGRTTAETLKAAMLSPHLGAARAAAIAATNQSLSLIAAGLLSLIAGVAAWRLTGASLITLGVFAHFAVSVTSGLTLALLARRPVLSAWVMRRFGRAGNAAIAFQDAVREHAPVPARTLAALWMNRALQATQFAVLLAAVGAGTGPWRALLAHGVNAVGTALGDLIPAQVGATDSVFTLAAPMLGMAGSRGVALSVLGHVIQVVGALTGTVAGLVWRRRQPAGSAEPAVLPDQAAAVDASLAASALPPSRRFPPSPGSA